MFKKMISATLVITLILISAFGAYATENSEDVNVNIQELLQEPTIEVLEQLQPRAPSITYMVIGDGVRLRSSPSLSGTVLGLLYYGDFVNGSHIDDGVYADGYLWKYVYSYNHGVWGYVADIYLVEAGEE